MKMNQRGLTLVEVTIGFLVLGLVLLAWMSLEVFTARAVKKVGDFSTSQKVILTIMNEILTAEKGIPPLRAPAALTKYTVTPDELAQTFENVGNKKIVCYDNRAGYVTDLNDPKCHYRVRYFKYTIADRQFAGNPQLAPLPLARVVVQITYKDEDDPRNKDADVNNDVVTKRYLTRLVSNVAEF